MYNTNEWKREITLVMLPVVCMCCRKIAEIFWLVIWSWTWSSVCTTSIMGCVEICIVWQAFCSTIPNIRHYIYFWQRYQYIHSATEVLCNVKLHCMHSSTSELLLVFHWLYLRHCKVIWWLGGVMVGRRTLGQLVVGLISNRVIIMHQVATLGKLFTPMCLCHHAVSIGTGKSWGIKWATTPHYRPWSCSFSWCLAEALELEINAAPAGSGPWMTILLYFHSSDILTCVTVCNHFESF